MQASPIPTTNTLVRTADIEIDANRETIFKYISNGDTLPAWLKKCGPINGAVKTQINNGSYNAAGASRTVSFGDGSTLTEQLLQFNPFTYYSYSVTGITSILRHLTNIGYGQWWFEERQAATGVKWAYSFVPKNRLARMALSLFLSLFYQKFMHQSLQLAKAQIEQLTGNTKSVS